jgi:hypothetical protein
MDSTFILLIVGAVAIGIFFLFGNKKKKENAGNKPRQQYGNKKQKKKQEKMFIPRTNSQVMSMFFKDYDEKTGIMRIGDNTYSVCFEFSDVSFAKANEEEQTDIFMKYVDFLNSLTTNMHIQVIHCGIPVATDRYKEDYNYPLLDSYSDNEKRLAGEFNDMIEGNLGSSKTTFCETRLIVVTLIADSLDAAKDELFQYQMQIEEKFSTVKSKIRKWSIQERLQFLYDTFNLTPYVIKYPNGKKFSDILTENKDLSIYDVLAPKEEIDPREQKFIVIGEKKFIKTLYVNKYPTSLTPEFYNRLTQLEANIIVTENIVPTDPAKTIKKLEKKISGLVTERYDKIKKSAKNNVNYEYVKDEKLEEKIDNQEGLRKALVKKKQKLFRKTMLICITASDYDELMRVEKQIRTIAGEFLFGISSLDWQQFEGLQNILPYGYNNLQFYRSLHSEAVAESVPFNSKKLLQKHSLYYGVDLVSKSMVCCDRKKLMNGNGCILATSGAGKSFFVKTNIEQINLRYPEDEICVLDPQGEYNPVVNALNGQIIEISTTANTYINPFDMELQYVDEDNDPIKTKIEYILAFMESIVGHLTGEQESIIDRATKRIYEKYFNAKAKGENDVPMPSFPVFYEEIKTYHEEEAKNLVLILERYVQGGMDIFSKDTNVNIKNRIVCFDLHNLTASMQTTGYLVVLEHIMNRVARNKAMGRNTWLWIDEFHILLANNYSADYIAKIFKIGRKLGCLPTVITQNIADVLKSEQGCKILSNSEFAAILKQKTLDLMAICKIFNISPEEAKYCSSSAPSGQGIIVYGEDIVPFRNRVSKDTYIYELNNTDGMQIARG